MIMLGSCSPAQLLSGVLPLPQQASPQVPKITLKRDVYGFAHIHAPHYFGAGYGVGVAQVDDYGLDLPFFWALYSPDIETRLNDQAISFALPGQLPPVFQFDSRSFPLPISKMQSRAATLEEIRLTLDYLSLYESTEEALARIDQQPSLKQYLEGYVAGVNDRLAQKQKSYTASTDPRIQYMVSRGLHTRQVQLADPMRAASSQSVFFGAGLVLTWVGFIDSVPAAALTKARLQLALSKFKFKPERPKSSNEFGFSGAATVSSRPIIMVDPHLPTHDSWLNSATAAVIHTPEIVLDAAILVGQPVPSVGHALHPKTQSAIAISGTANAQTPSTCWYAPVPADLSTYATSATANQPVAFTTRQMGRLTLREAGVHGRLIGQKRVKIGNEILELGFLYRATKDHKFTSVETLWPAFHSKSITEFYAALDRHQHPFWNMTVGISTPQKPSTLLYVNNQVSPRRNPNPDGNSDTLDDWNTFMDASNPATQWLGGYHTAAELPQIVAEESGRQFLHCHNCQPERVTGVISPHPYLIGGYAGFNNPRQVAGDRFYAQAVADEKKLSLDGAVKLANHPIDPHLEEAVQKLTATFAALKELLSPEAQNEAASELARWNDQPVDGSQENGIISRVLHWIDLMLQVQSQWRTSTDLQRIVLGFMFPEASTPFDPASPLSKSDASLALNKLVEAHRSYSTIYKTHRADFRPWGEIQRFRPTIFGKPMASGALDLPIAGAPNALLSVAGPTLDSPTGRVRLVTGGQNYVQLIEVGVRSILKKSVAGTTDPTLPYASKMSELFAAGVFTPTGVRESEMTAGRVISTETIEVREP
jgi:hypothetical protein